MQNFANNETVRSIFVIASEKVNLLQHDPLHLYFTIPALHSRYDNFVNNKNLYVFVFAIIS